MATTKKPQPKDSKRVLELIRALQLASITLQLVSDSGLLKGKSKKATAASSIIAETVSAVIADTNLTMDVNGIKTDTTAVLEASNFRGLRNALSGVNSSP